MTSSLLKSGYTFSIPSTGGVWSWSVQSDNTQTSGQYYQFTNINTPYGPIYSLEIPIPSDVVTAMYDSLVQYQQQLSPLLSLTDPSKNSYVFTITEGDPTITVSTSEIQNSGAFGSFMIASATSNVPWLVPQPSTISGLGRSSKGNFSVSLIPTLLTSANSPYTGVISLQDNRVPRTLIPISYIINVLPRPQITLSSSTVTLSYVRSTSSSGGVSVVNISNTGSLGSILNFGMAKVNNNSPWLLFSPLTGGPLNQGAYTPVTFSVVNASVPAIPGTYTESVLLTSSNASNSPKTISVSLIVT